MNRLVIREGSLVIALMAITAFFAWHTPAFLSSRNLSNLGVEFAITSVLALGVFLVLLPGQTDLSTGSGVGLIGGIAAVLIIQQQWPAWLGMAVALVVALVLWTGMGWMVVRHRIPAFIMTLAGLLIFRGLQWKIIHSQTVPVTIGTQDNLLSLLTTCYLPPWAGWLVVTVVVVVRGGIAWLDRRRRLALGAALEDRDITFTRWLISAQLLILGLLLLNHYHGIPLPVLILGIMAMLVSILTARTPFGRHLYAIGGNAEASRLSGVRVERTVIIAFTLCGGAVALTGFLQTAYTGASTTTVGSLMELDAIAACVIGGVSLSGGVGSVSGVLFGSLIMATLLNGMTLMAVEPEIKYMARGGVLALAVWMDVTLSRRGA